MALSSPVSEAVYTGNGTTTVFPTVFKFFNNADVIVQRQNPGESNPTQLTEGVHYTLTGAGVDGGGNVTMLSAPVSGATLTIRRSVFFTQPTAFQAQGSFSPKLHENALDYVTMQTQQLQRDASDLADTVADQAADIAALTTTVNSDVSTLNAAIVTGDNTVRSEFAAALAAAVLGAGGGGSSQPFDVKTYGALGNGIADDTAPIQAALDAAGTLAASTGRRCAVYLPPGKYMISKPLFMTQATALFTDSRGAAIIEAFTTFRGYSLICGPNYSTLVQGPFAIGSFSTPGQFSYAWSQKDGFNGSYFDLGQTAEGRLPDNANWTVNIKFKFANTLTDGRRVWGAEGNLYPNQHKSCAGITLWVAATATFLISFRYNGYWYDLLPTFSGISSIAAGSTHEFQMSWDQTNGKLRVWLDGVLWNLGSWTPPGTGGAGTVDTFGFQQYPWETIGLGLGQGTGVNDDIAFQHHDGTLYWYHVSNVVRNTASYTPTGAVPTADGNTRLLITFDSFYRGCIVGHSGLGQTVYIYPTVEAGWEQTQIQIKNVWFNYGSGILLSFCSLFDMQDVLYFTPADGIRRSKNGYEYSIRDVFVILAGRCAWAEMSGSYGTMDHVTLSGPVCLSMNGMNVQAKDVTLSTHPGYYMGAYVTGGGTMSFDGLQTDAEENNTTAKWFGALMLAAPQVAEFRACTLYNPPNKTADSPIQVCLNTGNDAQIDFYGLLVLPPATGTPVFKNLYNGGAGPYGTDYFSKAVKVHGNLPITTPYLLTDSPWNFIAVSDAQDFTRDQLGTAAPTTGTWKKGNRVWNTNPTTGGFMGWVCTADGSPGTWKTFGPIS
jgi:hypothetical protein